MDEQKKADLVDELYSLAPEEDYMPRTREAMLNAAAEVTRLRSLNAILERLGTQMSNVLFNLEQSDSQSSRDRRTMRELTTAWDAAVLAAGASS